VYEYSPAQIKQHVADYGASSKEQIQQMVKLLLELDEVPQPDDAADALAVAICHLRQTRLEKIADENIQGRSAVIASLKGVIEYVSTDYAVIDVGGIGFRIFAPTSTLSSLGMPGEKIHIYTHTHVREDAIVLYGFKTPDELNYSRCLSTCPVSALNWRWLCFHLWMWIILYQLSPGGMEAFITSIPGIGKKLAGRLLLELKDKIASNWSGPAVIPGGDIDGDVMAALLSLGYSANEASQAISSLPGDKALTLEEKIKLALGWFGKE